MANGNGNGKIFKWIATIALGALLTAGGIIRASDKEDVETNAMAIVALKKTDRRLEKKVDSLIVGQQIQALRDSFFQAAVLKALNVESDSSDSN